MVLGGIMNYKDGKLMFKILKRIKEQRKRYYVDAYGVVQMEWAGKWTPYHIVVEKDKRLAV